MSGSPSVNHVTSPPQPTILVSCYYNSTPFENRPPGLGWVRLFDNRVLCWIIDTTDQRRPIPVIIGTMPPPSADTGIVKSPVWGVRDEQVIKVPDMWRGSVLEFFTFIATNNDATRKIYADFSDVGLMADFNAWAISHPDLALNEVPEAGAEL